MSNHIPLGATVTDKGVKFAIFSSVARHLCLVLFDENQNLLKRIKLDPSRDKTDNIWQISTDEKAALYCWEVNGTPVIDPYAKDLASPTRWGDIKDYFPLAKLPKKDSFDWEDDKRPKIKSEKLIVYEMHVRGFTQDKSAHVINPGTFLGLIEKIPHLKELGINAVKLLPIQEFNECEYKPEKALYNYWGYSTVNYFCPMGRYAIKDARDEFCQMVKALHKAGIEVILDIVFNHTAEQDNKGPTLHFKALDPKVYYLFDDDKKILNVTGCGNTLNCNHPVVQELIISSLRYWTDEMHVDGFRFDLGAVFKYDQKGKFLKQPPILQKIAEDPRLKETKLIVEPWDAAGLYRLGLFYPGSDRFSEWNDQFRDAVRAFLRGDIGHKKNLIQRLMGSPDIFSHKKTPSVSINYSTAHDGFTLRDLVSYNQKHNLANQEDGRDGNSHNISWNCGVEGQTEDPDILSLRARQMRNFHLILMVSFGTPMIMMGDEYGHSKNGNNNSWCHDSRLNWFCWDLLDKNRPFFQFYKKLIAFRKNHPIFHAPGFIKDDQIDWYETDHDLPILSFRLKDDKNGYRLFIAFNASDDPVTLQLPERDWNLIVDTAREKTGRVESALTLEPHSCAILKAIEINGKDALLSRA